MKLSSSASTYRYIQWLNRQKDTMEDAVISPATVITILFLPHTVFVISINEQLSTNTTAATLRLTAKLKIFEETIVDELSLNVTTAVQSRTVLSPADTLSCHTPLSGRYTAGTQSL